jgi:hypothetical protein
MVQMFDAAVLSFILNVAVDGSWFMVSIQGFATSVMFTWWVSARIVATHGVGTTKHEP